MKSRMFSVAFKFGVSAMVFITIFGHTLEEWWNAIVMAPMG